MCVEYKTMAKLANLLLKSVLIGLIVACIDLSFVESERRKSGWVLLMMGVMIAFVAFLTELGIEGTLAMLDDKGKDKDKDKDKDT